MTDHLCDTTDLPIGTCGCTLHHRPEATVVSIAALERLAGRPLPAYRMTYRDPRWKITNPEPTSCDHRNDGLCGDCETLLEGLLHDLPALVEQLGVAARKDVRFAPHGHRKGDQQHPDESPIPWSPAATRALDELLTIVRDPQLRDPARRRQVLTQLSRLAAKAHRILERPEDIDYVGPCPQCTADLWVVRGELVTCKACDYKASWIEHHQNALEARGDQMMTIHELTTTLKAAGEPITRKRIEYLQDHHGLPREKRVVPHWQGQTVVTSEVWLYRLADVRELEARLKPNRVRQDTGKEGGYYVG